MAGTWNKFVVWRKPGELLPAPLNTQPLDVVLVLEKDTRTVYAVWNQLATHMKDTCSVGRTQQMRIALGKSAYRGIVVSSGGLLSELRRLGGIKAQSTQAYLAGAPGLAAIVGTKFLNSAAVSGSYKLGHGTCCCCCS